MVRKTPLKREPIASLEDLRDDCVAVVLNSGLSFVGVHDRGGPTPQTTSRWLYKETMFPQLATIRAMLNACGHDITIAPKGSMRIQRINPEGDEQVVMPEKKSAPSVSRLKHINRPSAMIAGKGVKNGGKPIAGMGRVAARQAARKAARKTVK